MNTGDTGDIGRDISGLGAAEIAAAVRARHLSAREVTWAALRRIEALDPALGCFLLRDDTGALAQAAAIDEALANPRTAPDLPLCGVPVALKDNLITASLPTTCGSRILASFVPPYDATAVTRLRRAGAVLLGKLNMDEFAMGSSGENSSVRPCRNPWDLNRVPGGSSSGAAAAVAAGLCPLALGSDTGGSIRQPAALCGITGLKPTYGRVSRHGLVAFASSLDQIGPLCRTAADAALCLAVIGGHDPLDATSLADSQPRPPPDAVLAALGQTDVRGLRIGLPEEYFGEGLDPQVEACVRQALATLEAAGAVLRPLHLPMTRHAVAAYYLIATAEASSNLARYDGVRYGLRAGAQGKAQGLTEMLEHTRSEGFGPEVKRRILLGTYVLRSGYYDAYYRRASQVRTLIRRDFQDAFAACDVIATPTSPIPAFPLGARVKDPLSMYLADVYTIGANLAGLPGISVPCGLIGPPAATAADRPLPVGLQLLGPPLGDEMVLRAAAAYQRLTDWHTRRPGAKEAA